jgi:hypothetical protein
VPDNSEAAVLFNEILEDYLDDPPSKVYLKRCQKCLDKPLSQKVKALLYWETDSGQDFIIELSLLRFVIWHFYHKLFTLFTGHLSKTMVP